MLHDEIDTLEGVKEKRKKLLSKLGINTVMDLLNHFPRGYEDRSKYKLVFEVQDGETVSLAVTAMHKPTTYTMAGKGFRTVQRVKAADNSGIITLTWFNQRHIAASISEGDSLLVYGKAKVTSTERSIITPAYEKVSQPKLMGRIVPTYPLTSGVTQNILRNLTLRLIESDYLNEVEEILPPEVITHFNLTPIAEAYKNIHYPTDEAALESARHNLIFRELYMLYAGIMLNADKPRPASTPMPSCAMLRGFCTSLPFSLTKPQINAINEIRLSMACDTQMNRLLQGDVGSGKTVVAAAAMLVAHENGAQSAIMAPTEILAAQHYESLTELYKGYDIKLTLLTGSLSAREKKQAIAAIASGDTQIAVGTHAIFQQHVEFQNLGLAVLDEQHRFGVLQREALAQKGSNPHILNMSATPIPRSLALVLYADMDISVINQMPIGRKPIKTYVVNQDYRKRIYNFLLEQIRQGHQAYIVCPLVEENDDTELNSVKTYTKNLKQQLNKNIELLHGKLPAKEKDSIMQRFLARDIDILVSTTVIEVGVNVPNATVMVVEDGDRFGLSQLHQLRGRVGRSSTQSYCIIVTDTKSEKSKSRLDFFKSTTDGFALAEYDLQARGAGDLFGTKQHGLPTLRIANLYRDFDILQKIKEYLQTM